MPSQEDLGRLFPPCAAFPMDAHPGKGQFSPHAGVDVEKDGRPAIPRDQREVEAAVGYWELGDCALRAGDQSGASEVARGKVELIVTSRNLRGTVVEGMSAAFGALHGGASAVRAKNVFAFRWPLDEVDAIVNRIESGRLFEVMIGSTSRGAGLSSVVLPRRKITTSDSSDSACRTAFSRLATL